MSKATFSTVPSAFQVAVTVMTFPRRTTAVTGPPPSYSRNAWASTVMEPSLVVPQSAATMFHAPRKSTGITAAAIEELLPGDGAERGAEGLAGGVLVGGVRDGDGSGVDGSGAAELVTAGSDAAGTETVAVALGCPEQPEVSVSSAPPSAIDSRRPMASDRTSRAGHDIGP